MFNGNFVAPGTFCPADKKISCTGRYTLTQTNVDGAHIFNTATAIASPLAGGDDDSADGSISGEDSDMVSWLLHPDILVGEMKD